MRTSLPFKLSVRVVGAVGLCLLLVGVFEFRQARRDIEHDLKERVRTVTGRLALSLALPLHTMDDDVIGDIIAFEMRKEGIAAVTVEENRSGQSAVAGQQNRRWGTVGGVPGEKSAASFAETAAVVFEGQVIGTVSVSASDTFAGQQLGEQLVGLALRLLLLLLLVGGALAVFVYILVSIPLIKLSRSCQKMVAGEYDVDVDSGGSDEIGSLGESICRMRDAIGEKIAVLEKEVGERRRSEEELGRLRSQLRGIIDAMPSILIGVDTKLVVNQWNREAEKATGISRRECEGRNLMELVPPLASWRKEIARSVKGERSVDLQRLSLDMDSRTRIYDVAVYPVAEGKEAGGVIRLDDVTDKVTFEEVMVQTEKMMSVGGLAAGMAHELNNPLAGIMQSVQVIENRISPELAKNRAVARECGMSLESLHCYVRSREIDTMLKSVLQSGDRASRIIRNLLAFSRKSNSQYTPEAIDELLERAVELAANDYQLKKLGHFRDIEIVRQYEEGLPRVRCDGGTMQQVFFNLFKNGVQALSEAGRSSKPGADALSPQIRLKTYSEKGYVKIEIADNGIGMDAPTCRRIFEPFFTTREVGSGRGLGLSVCFFIVEKNHNGKLEVDSAPNQGTTFTISLPL